jgi:uncharacterized phage infection (PIP) family protein YhgE
MDEDKKIEMRKLGLSERLIMLYEESERFIKDNKDFMNKEGHSEEERKKMKEITEKYDWYIKEIDSEFRKVTDEIEEYLAQLEKKSSKMKDDYIHMYG